MQTNATVWENIAAKMRAECDVLVVGGGASGIMAALAATCQGAKTILVEKNSVLGGNLLCGNACWPDFSETQPDTTDHKFLHELSERLHAIDGATAFTVVGDDAPATKMLLADRERLPFVLAEMLQSYGVSLYLRTIATKVLHRENHVEGTLIQGKSGLEIIRARAVIDCTGHRHLADATFDQAIGTIGFGMENVDLDQAKAFLASHGMLSSQGFTQDKKGQRIAYLQFAPDSLPALAALLPAGGTLRLFSDRSNHIGMIAGLEEPYQLNHVAERSRAMAQLNTRCLQMGNALKQHIPGFENAHVDWRSPIMGSYSNALPTDPSPIKGLFAVSGSCLTEDCFTQGQTAGMDAAAAARCFKDMGAFSDLKFETPVETHCDVLVAGGGAAGIIAAVAAARHGAKVILVDAAPVLAGDMLAGGISWLSFFNVFKQFNVPCKQVLYGLPYELIQRLEKEGSSPGFYDDLGPETQESRGTQVDRETIREICFTLMQENNVQLYLETLVCGVLQEEDRLHGVIVQSGTQRFAIEASVVLDCTGDGDVSALAGVPYQTRSSHDVGMAFGVSRVDFNKAIAFGREHHALIHDCTGTHGRYKGKLVKMAIRTARIPELKQGVIESNIHGSFCVTIAHDGEASYINGVNMKGGGNVLDPELSTATLLTLRSNVQKAAAFLRREIPGYEQSFLSWTSPNVGPRWTRMVECEYDIPQEHVQKAWIPEDSIGLFGSQDAHYLGHYIDEGKWYGIPYRALIPKNAENLLVAGRMITSNGVAHMSTRLIGSCFLQGQAAGTAAALSLQQGCTVRELDVKRLQRTLREDGVWLGDEE